MSYPQEFWLELELLDYWHAGSSRGRGVEYDAEVLRSTAGLPYLPGRSLRGLLREGLLQAEESGLPEVTPGLVAAWFGSEGEPGRLVVSNATLGAAMEQWAAATDDTAAKATLFHPLASTAIEPDTGTALDKSLRTVEVAVPVTLHASVQLDSGPEDPGTAAAALAAGLRFVRGLGKTRRRGLGRVEIRLRTEPHEQVKGV